MAKRKRLTPAQPEYLGADTGAPETKSYPLPPTPPIAQVAGDSAAAAALVEVSEALTAARSEGRLIQKLPLSAIVTDHLVRDRLAWDEGEMAALTESLRAHGQRTPIEVTALGDDRFGLISGWRRLRALERLFDETGDARFSEAQALLRSPETAGDAYVAMVEENEIRVGLSYYERARVAAKAVEAGVFPTAKVALQNLFATASRAKRSKIRAFLTIHEALDAALRFATDLTERQGLTLAAALDEDPTLGAILTGRLEAAAPESAADEKTVIDKALAKPAALRAPKSTTPQKTASSQELRPGVFLDVDGGWSNPRLTLRGEGVTSDFRTRLENWLITGG